MNNITENFGAFLVKTKIITKPQYADAIEVHRILGLPFSKSLIELGYTSSDVLLPKLAEQVGVPFVDLEEVSVNNNAIATIPEEICKKYMVMPIDFEDDRLIMAMTSPDNVMVIDDLQLFTGHEISPVIATKEDIESAIAHYHKMAETAVEDLVGDDALDVIRDVAEEAPIVKLVNVIISQAVEDRASDIHIEPQEFDMRVRYRIDGVLHEAMRCPKKVQSSIISRIKIMAGVDIAEIRKPQDGRASMVIRGRGVDFRVSTLPSVYGERVVLRVLEKEKIMLDLNDLGFLSSSLERFKKAVANPYGATLVTGPTGSGKSTTLYATLNVLNTEGQHIITVEDPVEYRLPGINQVQVNPMVGLTFARGLRAMLRAAPDIIMIGEIRDHETAKIAVEAALTGHLVLSTLHTNTAPGAISRLSEMGIPPFLISSAIVCVQAQRLARRLCKECKEEYKPEPELLKRFNIDPEEENKFYRPIGCSKCNDTGYRGRVGVYEVMVISETIEKLIIDRATTEEITQVAIDEGMIPLKEDGIEKVKMGMTSLEEIGRVVV